MAFAHQHRVEDVHQRFINEEGFEQNRHDRGPFSENEDRATNPCASSLEDSEEGHLRQVRKQE